MASRPRATKSSPGTASGGRTLFLAARSRELPHKTNFLAVEGTQVGDFSLLRLLGRGGMGEVWEAEQRSLNRRVALKLMLPERVDERSLEFFAREARAGGRLHHPGIVSVHDYGRDQDAHWISLELVDEAVDLRRSLETLKDRPRLPRAYAREVAAFTAELAEALQHAHEGGVIHRDLKPRNILVTPENQPKLTDFGLARITDESALSHTGDFVGTFYYMSPEQVAARRMGIDHRTDIFSLGVVLYEMLALRRPFEGDTSHEVVERILHHDPPSLRRARARVPRDLAVICGRALEKVRDQRYSTMADMAADLRRFLADEPVAAHSPMPWVQAGKWARRHPTRSAVGVVVAAALMIITTLAVAVFTARDRADEAVDVAEGARQGERLALAEAEHRAYSSRLHGARLALAAEGPAEARRLLDACAPELRGWEWAHLALRMDRSIATLTDDQGARGGELTPMVGLTALAYSADGTRLAIGDRLGGLSLWDAQSNQLRSRLEGHASALEALAFSPDGRLLASGSRDSTVVLWDARTGSKLEPLVGHEHFVTAVAFAGDRWLVSGSRDGTLRIWDVETGTSLLTLEPPIGTKESGAVHAIAVQAAPGEAAGSRILSGSEDGVLRVWDAKTGELLLEFSGNEGPLRAVAFDASGERMLSGSETGAVCVWDATDGRRLARIDASDAAIGSVAFSPDGEQILSAGLDGHLELRDALSGELIGALVGHTGPVVAAAFSPTGNRIASGSADATVRLWDPASGGPVHVLDGHRGHVLTALFDPRGTRMASASRDGTVRLWDARSGACLHVLEGHAGIVEALAFDPEGGTLATAADDGTVGLWDAATGEHRRALEGHEGAVAAIGFAPSGGLLASASADGDLRLWDTTSGECTLVLAGHTASVKALAFDPTGKRLISASWDHTLRLWDVSSGACLAVLEDHAMAVSSVAFSATGGRIASGAVDGEIRVWDGLTGDWIATLEGHRSQVRDLAFAPDGTRLVSASEDGDLRLWDVDGGGRRQVLAGHGGAVSSVVFTPDGERVISGSEDGTLRVWDASTGECLATLTGHEHYVTDLDVDPLGRRVLSASRDGTLRLWESRLDDALAIWHAKSEWKATRERIDPLFDELQLVTDVVQAIEASGWSPEEKLSATEAAVQRGDPSPSVLREAAWRQAGPVGRKDQVYEAGLRWVQVALESAPESADLLAVLGVMRYRRGEFAEAAASLGQADDLRQSEGARRPLDLLFLAMARQQLDQGEQARELLEIARGLLEDANDPDLAPFLQEAAGLID